MTHLRTQFGREAENAYKWDSNPAISLDRVGSEIRLFVEMRR